jgi:hypothetical protein
VPIKKLSPDKSGLGAIGTGVPSTFTVAAKADAPVAMSNAASAA